MCDVRSEREREREEVGDDITYDSVNKLSVSIRIYELSGSQCSMSNLGTNIVCTEWVRRAKRKL